MKKNQKGFAHLAILVVLVVILISGVGYFVYRQHHNKAPVATANSTPSKVVKQSTPPNKASSIGPVPVFTLPADWSWYTDTTNGFKLAYPNAWGAPRNTTVEKGTAGQRYDTSWFSSGKYLADIFMETEDYVFQGCNDSSGCKSVQTSNTKAEYLPTIERINAGNFNGSYNNLVSQYSDGYTTILTNPGEGETDLIDSYRIVSLPALNISAVHGEYELLNVSGDCLQKQVSPSNIQPCITQDLSDTFAKILSSIQAL